MVGFVCMISVGLVPAWIGSVPERLSPEIGCRLSGAHVIRPLIFALIGFQEISPRNSGRIETREIREACWVRGGATSFCYTEIHRCLHPGNE